MDEQPGRDDFSFPPKLRLRTSADYQRVMRARCSVANGILVLYGLSNDLPHARLGMVVSRRVGNSVERHRRKRLLREAFRLAQHQLPSGLDLVAVARPGPMPTHEQVSRSLLELAARLKRRLAKQADREQP